MVYQLQQPTQALCPLAEMWFARSVEGTVPSRAAFTPSDLRPWMGWIAIFQAIDRTPLRLRVRLFGTHLAAQTGYDLTGKVVPDDAAIDFQPLLAGKTLALETGQPVYESIDAPGLLRYARLVLPVASEGGAPDTLITSIDATDLRTTARSNVSLTRALATVADRMERVVLSRPAVPDPDAAMPAPEDGPDVSA